MTHTLQKDFLKYVSLNILGMLGISCYILADTYFIAARLGADGLTALNLAIAVYSFIHGTGLMIGIGGATKYAICRSRGEKERADEAFTAAVVLGMGIGIALFAAGILGAGALAGLLGAKDTIWGMCTTYLKTILCFSPCFILNNIFLAFVRNDGQPRLSMAGMLTGSFSNIILDYLFLFPLNMGMFGAAFATGLAPVISMLVLSLHVMKKQHHFRFCPGKALRTVRYIRQIGALGISAFINEISSGVVLIVFNLLILSLAGNTGVAAYGIVANLALVALSVFTGISQGSQPLISDYYGRGQKREVNKIYKYTVIMAAAIGILLTVLAFGWTDALIAVFNSEGNEELRKIAYDGLRLYFPGFLAAGINIVTASYLGALEQVGGSFLVAVMRGFVAILAFAFLLSATLGMKGIWLAFGAAELVTVLVSFGINKRRLSEMPKKERAEEPFLSK